MQRWPQQRGRTGEQRQEGVPVVLGVEQGGRIKQVRFDSSTLYAPFDLVAKRYGADAASSPRDNSPLTKNPLTKSSRARQSSARHNAVRDTTGRDVAGSETQREALSLSVLLTTLLIMAGTFHVVAMIVIETNRWLEARAQVAYLESNISTIREDMTAIETQLVYRNDDGVLEQLARRQGFIYPNETRIITSFDTPE